MATAPPLPVSPLPYPACRYTAFFSYAHDDDAAWNDWVTSFNDELRRGLGSRLRGVEVHDLHVSGDAFAQSGLVSQVLGDNIAASFTMFLFVHDNYVLSDWCLRELQAFRQTFAEPGFRERLYIVVMSKSAWTQLQEDDRWRALFPYPDQRWLPFYRPTQPDLPYRIYSENGQDQNRKALVSPAFWEPLVQLREELVTKIRASLDANRHERSYPELKPAPQVAAPAAAEQEDVLVFIETPKAQEPQSQAIGREVARRWSDFVDPFKLSPPLLLRPTGLPMEDMQQRPRLANADGVILLWASKTPEALVVDIQNVEPSLEGPDFAPGLIAYAVSGSAADEPVERKVKGWTVVRFVCSADGQASPVDGDDADRLETFLNKVLKRKRKRLEAAATAGAATATAAAGA